MGLSLWRPLTFAAFLILPQFNHADTTYISTGEWKPFVSEDLSDNGVLARLVSESFKRVNIDIRYGFFPWKRALHIAKSGEWPATMPWSTQESRKPYFYLSAPIIHEENILVHHINLKVVWESIADLSTYTIGATNGYNYGKAFEIAESNGIISVERENTDEQNFKKLLSNRVQIVLADRSVATTILNKFYEESNSKNYIINKKSINKRSLHILFSKKHRDSERLLKEFNKGLKILQQSGDYQNILIHHSESLPE